MHGACVLGDRLGGALCLTSPGKAGWLAMPTPTAKGSVPYITGIKQAGGMEAAFGSAVTWTKTRSSGTLLTANLTTPPSVMLLLRRHIRVLRWMGELEDTELEQGREILVAASGNTKTVAERLRIYTRKRTLKSWKWSEMGNKNGWEGFAL